MIIRIRQEHPKDYVQINNLIKKTFQNLKESTNNEHELVKKLRKSKVYIPKLTLVAEVEGKVIGYIMHTKITLGSARAVCLAPLSVLPEMQGRNIGASLIKSGISIAQKIGVDVTITIGQPKFFKKFGFTKIKEFGIKSQVKTEEKHISAYCFNQNILPINSIIEYPVDLQLALKEFDSKNSTKRTYTKKVATL